MFNHNKFKNLRKNFDLLQSDIAEQLNVSTSTVGMWEQGRSQPDNEMIKKIANIFEVTTDYLLDNDENSKTIAELTYDDTEKANMQKMVADKLGQTLFKKYGELTEKDKKIILATINQIIENADKED